MAGTAAHNFDALVAAEPATFQLVGRTWEAPVELPHQAMLYLEALEQDHGADHELGYTDLVHIARLVFTDTVVDEWLEGGAGITRLSAVMEWVLDQFGKQLGTAEKATGEGGAANP